MKKEAETGAKVDQRLIAEIKAFEDKHRKTGMGSFHASMLDKEKLSITDGVISAEEEEIPRDEFLDVASAKGSVRS